MTFPSPRQFLAPLFGVCLLFAGTEQVEGVEFYNPEVFNRPVGFAPVSPRPRFYDDEVSMRRSPSLGPKHYRLPRNVGLKKYHPRPSKRGGGRSSVRMARGL